MRIRRFCTLMIASAVMASAALISNADEKAQFDLPKQPLGDSLRAVGDQANYNVFFEPQLVEGKTAPALSGTDGVEEALKKLLAGTGLTYRFVDERTVRISSEASTGTKPTAYASTVAPMRLAQAEPSASESSPSTESEDTSGDKLEEITVRGKPFTDANVDIVRTESDPQPYYIFSGEEIAEANTVNLEDFLKQRLTMNTIAGTYNQQFGGIGGNSYGQVTLRGLDRGQTLTLVNGRRVAGSNDNIPFDFNALSPSQIERIEVLPSSGSAIYGGQAIGGVLNIILKRDFTGGDFSLTYDTPLDTHAPVRSVSAGYGWNLQGGRTHLTLSVSAQDAEPLTWGDRLELVQRGLSRVIERAPGLIYSSNSPSLYGTTPNIASTDGSPLVFKPGTPLAGTSLGSSLTFIPEGISPSTSLADLQAGLLSNSGQQNLKLANTWLGSLQSLGAATETRSAFAALRHQLTDHLELIAEASWNQNKGQGSGPDSGPNDRYVVPADASTNPFGQDIAISIPTPAERQQLLYTTETLRGVLGFVADLPRDWRLQGDYTWNQAQQTKRQDRYFDLASDMQAFPAALAAGSINPFVDTLQAPLDLSPFLTAENTYWFRAKSELADTGLRLSGPSVHLPAGPVNLTLGLGYRQERLLDFINDNGPTLGRKSEYPSTQRVTSAYAEAWVPLIAPRNEIRGVRSLDLQIAHRLERFSVDSNYGLSHLTFPPDYDEDFGVQGEGAHVGYTANNTTLGLRYKPVDSLTLRASLATAFLPPAFNRLGSLSGDPTIRDYGPDPLRGGELIQARRITGGNPDLKPMDAESLNLGFLFEPTEGALEGSRFGFEWYRIDRKNLIFSMNSTYLIANEERYADRITRADPDAGDPYGVGPITVLDLRALNANQASTDGFDVNLGYRRASERHGIFDFELLATIVDSYTQVLGPGEPEMEIAGRVDDWNAPIKLRANATLGWERGPWSLSWTALYYGSYYGPSAELDELGFAAQGGATIPHQIYHNLLAGYRFPENERASGAQGLLSNLTVTVGVRNIFDTLPPFDVASSGYYSYFGDPRLRSVQLSVRKNFGARSK